MAKQTNAAMRAYRRAYRVRFSILKKSGSPLRRTGNYSVVAPGIDQQKADWKAVQHGESALAVIDAGGRFIGFIPPDLLLAILLHEHDEDMRA